MAMMDALVKANTMKWNPLSKYHNIRKEFKKNNQHGTLGIIDCDKIAKRYRAWFDSAPFDMGITTKKAFSSIDNTNPLASQAKRVAKVANAGS